MAINAKNFDTVPALAQLKAWAVQNNFNFKVQRVPLTDREQYLVEITPLRTRALTWAAHEHNIIIKIEYVNIYNTTNYFIYIQDENGNYIPDNKTADANTQEGAIRILETIVQNSFTIPAPIHDKGIFSMSACIEALHTRITLLEKHLNSTPWLRQ